MWRMLHRDHKASSQSLTWSTGAAFSSRQVRQRLAERPGRHHHTRCGALRARACRRMMRRAKVPYGRRCESDQHQQPRRCVSHLSARRCALDFSDLSASSTSNKQHLIRGSTSSQIRSGCDAGILPAAAATLRLALAASTFGCCHRVDCHVAHLYQSW